MDYDYIPAAGIEMKEGRHFSPKFPSDVRHGSLVNEEVIALMDKDSVVGGCFHFAGIDGQILGVMKNFHYSSMRTKIEPLAVILAPDNVRFLLIRIPPHDISGSVDFIQDTWKKIIPGYPLEYHFIDENFDRMYHSESRMGTLLNIFAVLAVVIACLGLFGLASYTAEQRTREIGIRKVLGAGVPRILALITREFFLLVLLANVIAWPAAYWIMNSWLKGYAYRTSLDFGLFAAALNHPNICTVYEVDEIDGQTFITMSYIKGQNLKDKIKEGPLNIDEAKDISLQIAEGLKEAHEKGIVHRDIKPANIMLTEKGQAKITDFGLAKLSWGVDLTKTSTIMGTAAYMSPEQAKGDKVDRRTDIWSLGAMLYEMFSGKHPFQKDQEQALIFAILNDKPTPLSLIRSDIPAQIENVIEKALSKKAAERYQNVSDFIQDLKKSQSVQHPRVLLRNKAGQQVLITLKSGETGKTRQLIITPTGNEYNLRYSDWEYTRRLEVEDKGKGDIGYVHLRAMGGNNITEWYRNFYPVFKRKGLIIDVRHNRGGNIDAFILEKLIRKAWFYWKPRAGSPYWNMHYAFRGHMVVLCDEYTASDGEAFAEGFKRLGLGKVIGTRTWSGEIWLSNNNRLTDRGLARAPQTGVYGPEREWLIEGHGVDPDIVVDNLPHATFKGNDAQLEAAIDYLKEQIRKNPVDIPEPPPYPDKSFKTNKKKD